MRMVNLPGGGDDLLRMTQRDFHDQVRRPRSWRALARLQAPRATRSPSSPRRKRGRYWPRRSGGAPTLASGLASPLTATPNDVGGIKERGGRHGAEKNHGEMVVKNILSEKSITEGVKELVRLSNHNRKVATEVLSTGERKGGTISKATGNRCRKGSAGSLAADTQAWCRTQSTPWMARGMSCSSQGRSSGARGAADTPKIG